MANFPSSSLEPGMSGSQVKQLQQYLMSMGYSIPDGATGYYGNQTKAAVTQLQRDLGVNTGGYDGYWGPKTQQSLTKMTGDTGSTQTNQVQSKAIPGVNYTPMTTTTNSAGQTEIVPKTTTQGQVSISNNQQLDYYKSLGYTIKSDPNGNGAIAVPPTNTPAPAKKDTSSLDAAVAAGTMYKSSSGLYFPVGVQPSTAFTGNQPPTTPPPVQPPTTQPVSVTGNPALDAMYKEIEDIVAKMGQINPKANITPAMLDNFYNQAVQNMSPYYKEQLNMIRNDLTTSAKYLNEQYESQRDRAAQDFRQSLGLSRERDAGAGLAFSGAGTRRELETTSALNRSLEDMYRTTESNLSSRLLDTESKIGTAALPSLPSLNMYRASNLGKGAITSTGSNIIRPLTGITGSMEREKTTAIEKEKARLESAERTRQLNNY